MPKLSLVECTSLAKSALIVGTPLEHNGSSVEGEVAALLTRCIVACSTEIGSDAASKILDLVLILLRVSRYSSDLDATILGLFVIGITAGHACNRVGDILDIENQNISFVRSYLAAQANAVTAKR